MVLGLRVTKFLFFLLQGIALRSAGMDTQNCTVTVNQVPLVVHPLANNLTIACSFTALHCTGSPEVMWFHIRGNRSRSLCPRACGNVGTPGKFHLEGPIHTGNANLAIQQVSQEDNGVYYCGVAFRASRSHKSRQMGSGTTLRVGGDRRLNLWLQSALLTILSLYALCITINLAQTIRSTTRVDLLHRNPSSITRNRRAVLCRPSPASSTASSARATGPPAPGHHRAAALQVTTPSIKTCEALSNGQPGDDRTSQGRARRAGGQ
ncbi:immunoglobulin superfamily member 6 isoform X2 [Pristis pectinata]|uniref:immunoglobulin superfamily member 6 isoform X2 n=1 Tax=Pristis pectinata TaxID=685728 RepID=UPI00223D6DD9|nr:immunoglobulin superfamily member 6 isoform X2 [Pristis pectinata]